MLTMMNSSKNRKVRVACQRCRSRRIKCDGGVPACSNCAKAGVVCIDVAAHDADHLVSRSFAVDATARIEWLENIIRTHLPSIDLTNGPQVDYDASSVKAHGALSNQVNETSPQTGPGRDFVAPTLVDGSGTPSGANTTKRSFADTAEPSCEHAFTSEARSVASNLGMLSLNSDSREKHYLGSSSGLLFSHLIQAGLDTTEARPSVTASHPQLRQIRTKGNFKPFYDALDMTLPRKEDALFLFDVYFQHAYYEHPILHPQSIFDCLDTLYICKATQDKSLTTVKGWPKGVDAFSYNGEIESNSSGKSTIISIQTAMFHVFMVLTLAATTRVREGNFDFAPTQFYQVVELVSPDTLAETSVASLQAAYLLAHHAFMAPAKLNIWTLVHVCMAHAIDLGLHRDPNSASQSANITRKVLFYCVYSLDRSVATIQGRPLCIRDETFDVDMPNIEELEADLDQSNLADDLKVCIKDAFQYSVHRFRLSFIISRIKTRLYHLPARSESGNSPDFSAIQAKLHLELESWHSQTNTYLTRLEVPDEYENRKWYLKLELLYYSAIVLLFQPSQAFRQPSTDAYVLCFNGAMQQILCFEQLHQQDALFLGWRHTQAIFSCGATIMYCFWTSKAVQRSQLAEKIPSVLRICINFLTIGGVWWPSVKKGKVSFERLVEITLQRYSDKQKDRKEDSAKKRARTGQQFRAPKTGNQQHEPTLAGYEAMSHRLPNAIAYNDSVQNAVNLVDHESGLGYDSNWSQIENQNSTFDSATMNTSLMGGLENPDMLLSDGTFGASPTFMDPEIRLFLDDYFLVDDSWNVANAGPPMSFHFGDL